ncbi:SET domain-containing protein [Mycena chlorophos]|uniref:SET domain-containing protein n=1 Tax=Mycena chlorophos TaxID=658473 RepID=A0A8H6S0G7_MYCCL|nr:SET domain-containing protein [Mycena chlorophos]
MPTVLIYDILRLILEMAAQDDRRTAIKLVLVSRTVQEWIDLVLYNSIYLRRQRTTDNFLRTIETSLTKPRSFFATRVKSVSILFDMRPEDVVRLSSVCRGIENITSWYLPSPAFPGTTARRRPSPLSCLMFSLRPRRISSWHGIVASPDPHFSLPFFSAVTHLTIVNVWEEWASWPWPGNALPSLTHLSLDYTFGARTLPCGEVMRIGDTTMAILSMCCPALRVCGLRIDQLETAPSVLELASYFECRNEPRVVLYRHREPFQIREAHSPSEKRVWAALEKAVGQLVVGAFDGEYCFWVVIIPPEFSCRVQNLAHDTEFKQLDEL